MKRFMFRSVILLCWAAITTVCVAAFLYLEHIWLYQAHRNLFAMLCVDGSKAKHSLYIGSYNNKKVLMSKCLLRVPELGSAGLSTPVLESKIPEKYLQLPENVQYADKVLILTPLRDAESDLQQFAELLNTLTYPHRLIRVCFGEEGSSDNTYKVGQQITQKLRTRYGFKNSTIFKMSLTGNSVHISKEFRHEDSIQIARRSHIAKARNILTKLALQDEKWVLWIDVDVVKIRPDTVQQFLFSDKDVMVSSTLREVEVHSLFGQSVAHLNYDLNSFNETVVKGTAYRLYTHDFKGAGRIVPIQFVGACVLMIKSECIQKGLHFPEEVITSPDSHVQAIESEGLGMLARKMGLGVYVLPFLESFHHL